MTFLFNTIPTSRCFQIFYDDANPKAFFFLCHPYFYIFFGMFMSDCLVMLLEVFTCSMLIMERKKIRSGQVRASRNGIHAHFIMFFHCHYEPLVLATY